MKKILFITIAFLMLFLTGTAKAANMGDYVYFNIDQHYDATGRSKTQATLVKTTSRFYFYVETGWWDAQLSSKRNEILTNLDNVSSEFNNRIYPTLTSAYGSEWSPGIDGDTKITVLFESTVNNLGGYVRSQDEYSTLQAPDSNEREMLYLPIAQINSSQLKVFLAHEFVHLIVFNQKDKLQNVQEEVWLSEARSDYASTILGYDDVYEGSNLQRRVQDFLNQPTDSLTEWQGTKYDYAVESLFTHYLVDHYGLDILKDSLASPLAGIPSINEALLKNGFTEDFSDIFTNWTVTMIINNCVVDAKYCYKNQRLTDLKINPTLIFLPLNGNSSLSMDNTAKNWSGTWQKIIGGSGDLKLEFSSFTDLNFQVPYIVYDKNNNYTVNFLKLDGNKKGVITIKNFGSNYNSLIVTPSLQTKMAGFDGSELAYPYTMTVSITKSVLGQEVPPVEHNVCSALGGNLSLGMSNNEQVKCLQQFLKLQGTDIYPEGFVTGLFGRLTKMAVVRFQEKYKNEVLLPVGLLQGTGFVGPLTRQKINQLLKP